MESGSATQEPLREVAGGGKYGLSNVFCKIGEGWTCVITRTEGPDAGKVFIKCGENCTCSIDGEVVSQESKLPAEIGSEAFCKCGEGWSCVISRTEPADVGKGFFECAEPCSCALDSSSTQPQSKQC